MIGQEHDQKILEKSTGMIGQEHDQKILEKSTGNDWSRT
jgi:hypothetical protein